MRCQNANLSTCAQIRLLQYAEQANCSWSRVAQLMGGTRSDVQCRYFVSSALSHPAPARNLRLHRFQLFRYWHMRIVASRNTSWTPAEDMALRSAIAEHGENNWEQIYAVMREMKLVSMRVGYIKGNGRTPLEYKNR